jgi:hypothetical protein
MDGGVVPSCSSPPTQRRGLIDAQAAASSEELAEQYIAELAIEGKRVLKTMRFPADRVARVKDLDRWYDQNKQELSLDVSARLLTNLHILLRNRNGIHAARRSELEDNTRHGAQYVGRIPTDVLSDRVKSVYNGQTRRSGQTVDECYHSRMKEHYRDYLLDQHWNPKEYAALCDPPYPPLPPSRSSQTQRDLASSRGL